MVFSFVLSSSILLSSSLSSGGFSAGCSLSLVSAEASLFSSGCSKSGESSLTDDSVSFGSSTGTGISSPSSPISDTWTTGVFDSSSVPVCACTKETSYLGILLMESIDGLIWSICRRIDGGGDVGVTVCLYFVCFRI